ncbi:MAG: YcgN family cysteine cluster protein [Novosphingobium sp.]
MSSAAPFWERPLATLSRPEWEALCDGCGQCCLHKVEDEDTGAIYRTNVACRLLDLQTARCCDYKHRKALVPDCLRLTPDTLAAADWLPETCAYKRRAAGLALPEWHYLVCGDREAVHRAGASVRGKAVSETIAGPIEQHIVWPEGMAPLLMDEP